MILKMKLSDTIAAIVIVVVVCLVEERSGVPVKDKGSRQKDTYEENTDHDDFVYVPESAVEAESEGAFQSDIMLTDEQWANIRELVNEEYEEDDNDDGVDEEDDDEERKRTKRKAVAFLYRRWPLKTVPYEITDESAEDIGVIMAGMKQWTDNTCIKFQPYTADQIYGELRHNSRISFIKDSRGCWSYLGRVFSGAQPISIGAGCETSGAVAHELGHVIGFHHEQSRPDRDDYVTIHWQNIEPGNEVNFAKYTWSEITTHEVPYDYNSLMHYGTHYFSKNGLPTITPNDPFQPIGNYAFLSFLDIKLANIIYKCNEDCATVIVCVNGGYQGPQCGCVCPPGYGGTFCEEVGGGPEPVGPTVGECSYVFTDATGVITSVNYPDNYDDLLDCTYRIQGGEGSSITLVFSDFDFEYEENCEYDHLNIRSGDTDLTGRTFCGSDLPPAFYTQNSEMILTFHSDPYVTGRGFRATYYINGPLVDEQTTTMMTPTTTTTEATTTIKDPTTTPGEGDFVGSCGGYFGALTGTLASPNYPADYPNNAVCYYTIVAPTGRRVELSIHHLDVEYAVQCTSDYVSVLLGNGIETPMRLCGSSAPLGTFISLENWIQVRFGSNASGTYSGFTLSYRTIDV